MFLQRSLSEVRHVLPDGPQTPTLLAHQNVLKGGWEAPRAYMSSGAREGGGMSLPEDFYEGFSTANKKRGIRTANAPHPQHAFSNLHASLILQLRECRANALARSVTLHTKLTWSFLYRASHCYKPYPVTGSCRLVRTHSLKDPPRALATCTYLKLRT